MTLNTLWFVLIALLYIGFFILEGFDFGIGILLPFIGRGADEAETDLKRRAIINTVGPFWDGNEVWLLTAGGATFAAFPQWYATMFSGFYLAFFLLVDLKRVTHILEPFRKGKLRLRNGILNPGKEIRPSRNTGYFFDPRANELALVVAAFPLLCGMERNRD